MFSENRAAYELCGENITRTVVFPLRQWLRERATMLRNAYNAHLVLLTYVWWAVAEFSALTQCIIFRFQHSFFLSNGRSNISLVGKLRHTYPSEQRRCTSVTEVCAQGLDDHPFRDLHSPVHKSSVIDT